jgi:dTDP-4-dehydrorhamnose reductase
MRMLVLGASGQIATALCEAGARAGAQVAARGRPTLDVTRIDTIVDEIAQTRPDLVVNAAAFTAVDKAETQCEQAFLVNETGASNAALAAADAKLPLFHLSTDYVFDGSSGVPYRETDSAVPGCVYGKSKLAGENAVRTNCPGALILRTAWIFSAHGQNFLRTMLALARDKEEIAVVRDQIGSPTFAGDIAEAIVMLARIVVSNPPSGLTLHMASPDGASRFELAEEIFRRAKMLGQPTARVKPVSSVEFPQPAQRPANSRLSSEKLERLYGIRLPAWRDGLARCMSNLASNDWSFG